MKKIADQNKSAGQVNSPDPEGKFSMPYTIKNVVRSDAQLEEEILRLRAQVASLTQELERCRAELTAAEFGTVMANRQSALDNSFTMVEAQNFTLMNLFVAATRLHSSTERSDVLTAIREILSDLIGSPATAVFEINPGSGALCLLESSGITPAKLSRIPLGTGCIGKVAATGEAYFGDGSDGEPVACVPLKIGPRVTGVIAVFRLLEQKLNLHSNDHELLDFMSRHAALALQRTSAPSGASAGRGTRP